ncbi:amidohydrolase family protein [Nocardia sp. BMG111209]|uniref:amidohydrolase family protein n=1 Tax=Nocardia sp. BMG111209 TaxID=1160137 RepID=UPI00035F66DF|nr:amidohydrolase family protein [Nocardia sp. BMG111209]
MTLIVHNAVLLPVAGERPWLYGWFTVGDDGRITALGEGEPPAQAGERLDAEGAFVAPGFVSAHSHIFTAGMRGVAPNETLYPWVTRNTEMLLAAGAEDLYWLTLAGAFDFLGAGVTSAYNFTQSRVLAKFDYETSSLKAAAVRPVEFLTRQIDAAADAGLRTVNAVRLDDEQLPEPEALAAFGFAMDHIASAVPPELNLGGSVFGSVQWSTAPVTAEREYAMMRRHRVTNQAHFVETAEQIDIQRAKFEWYDKAGVLGPDFAFGHFVHPTGQMVDRAAETGCAMVWQPMSNGRLGSGIADVPRFLGAGMRVGIGLDDQSCTDVADPFENMRTGLYLQRAKHSDAAVLTPDAMLHLHTLGGAAAIGVADRVGSLEVGKYADFVIVDPRRPDLGPIWDPVATYVLACSLRNLREVYVGGRRVWADGASTHPLAPEAFRQLHDRMVRVAGENGFRCAITRSAA